MKKMEQHYERYTDEDFEVWKRLFNRQMEILNEVACEEYLESLKKVHFKSEKIPDFNEINSILKKETGWQLMVVPHIIPNEKFFPLLSNRTFSATTWLRKMSELDYLEEPDMFHDVFGHVPLLSNPTFCAFFKGLADIGMKFIHDPKSIEMLGRMYWFTIEFGLIRQKEELKIYGAGILSSHGETKYCLSSKSTHLDFDVEQILNKNYDNMRIQDTYFVIESFEQLFASLPEIDSYIEKSCLERV